MCFEEIESHALFCHPCINGLSEQTDEGMKLYLKEWGRAFPLTDSENAKLALRAQYGDREARRQLIRGNFWLIFEVAREFDSEQACLLDRISYGVIGFCHAIDLFDFDEHKNLTMFAPVLIRESIGFKFNPPRFSINHADLTLAQ